MSELTAQKRNALHKGSGSAVSLRVDSNNLVWLERRNNDASIKRIPRWRQPGGASTWPGTFDGLALSGDYAYVTDGGSSLSSGSDGPMGTGTIYKVRVDQSEPTATLATIQPFLQGIIADATGVYWGGGIASDGGAPPATTAPWSVSGINGTLHGARFEDRWNELVSDRPHWDLGEAREGFRMTIHAIESVRANMSTKL